jgi:3-deoxy-D-manno-octulosonate 8-phosphate phosphatase (KDO 8-P phosphatase)
MKQSNILTSFKPIKAFVFDVDGVLTDGSLQLLENGELSRKMNIKDGYALQRAVKKGYHVAVITGGGSSNVVKRLKGLGIKDIFTKVQDKKEKLEDYLLNNGLAAEKVLYMGDDIPDHDAMQMIGLPVCPEDAAPEIKATCKYISPYKGGHGCVRDVIEKVLKLNEDWV